MVIARSLSNAMTSACSTPLMADHQVFYSHLPGCLSWVSPPEILDCGSTNPVLRYG